MKILFTTLLLATALTTQAGNTIVEGPFFVLTCVFRGESLPVFLRYYDAARSFLCSKSANDKRLSKVSVSKWKSG